MARDPRCAVCGVTATELALRDLPPLELHHRNGNKLDNRLENLEMLCQRDHKEAHRG